MILLHFAMKVAALKRKGRYLLASIYHNTILLMITGSIVGFIAALFIFFWEDTPWIKGQALVLCPGCGLKTTKGVFNQLPEFFTWVMLFTIHTGASLGLGLAALQKIRLQTLRQYRISKREIATSLFLVLLMIVVSSSSYVIPFNGGKYYEWPRIPLNHEWPKIILLLAISIVSASCAVLGLILVGCIARKLSKGLLSVTSLSSYFELKDQMEIFLMITGYILSSGMITVYFLKEAEAQLKLGTLFNDHAVAMFGLLFTIFIGITFIPCKISLSELGKKIAQQQTGYPPSEGSALKVWIDNNEAMENYLQLKFNALKTLKYAVPVLSGI